MSGAGIRTPWLSILIPVYNVERYLRDCIESVVTQAGSGVEVLLYEDVSTDGSRALLEQLVREERRIPLTVIWGERNIGLSGARNVMIDRARGDYLWLVDSDDLLAPGSIDALANIVAAHAPELVISDHRVLEERQRLKDRLRQWWRGQAGPQQVRTFTGPAETLVTDRVTLVQGLYEGRSLQTQLYIARRDVWARQLRFPLGRYFEDQATTPGLLMRAASVWYAPQAWYVYRRRGGSITTTMSGRKLDDCALAMSQSADDIRPYLPAPLPEAAALAIARFNTGNFIGISRRVARGNEANRRQRLQQIRDHFISALPLPLDVLLQDFRRRRGFTRWLKLRWRLRRAG